MSTEPKVRFMQDEPLGTVTLDSPPLNLIGADLIADLVAALDQVEAADGVRALVLRGAGTVFSAGADVALFAGRRCRTYRRPRRPRPRAHGSAGRAAIPRRTIR